VDPRSGGHRRPRLGRHRLRRLGAGQPPRPGRGDPEQHRHPPGDRRESAARPAVGHHPGRAARDHLSDRRLHPHDPVAVEPRPAALHVASTPAVLPATTSLADAFIRATLWLARPALPRDVQQAYLAPYRSRDRRKGIQDGVADIPASADHPSRATLERLAEGVRELRVPTLFAWGPRDITFSDRYLRDLLERVPHADVHRYENASHLVWEDADVAGTVAEWLADRFPASAEPG